MKKSIFAFKGESYKQDCGIYVSKTMERFRETAKLWPNGVAVEVCAEEVEFIRSALQKELGYQVRVFAQKP